MKYIFSIILLFGLLGCSNSDKGYNENNTIQANNRGSFSSKTDKDILNDKLAEFAKNIEMKTPEELINMIRSEYSTTDPYDYFISRDGNKLIEQELEKRGENARNVLKKNKDNMKSIFTGASGPDDTISFLCDRLLRKLN